MSGRVGAFADAMTAYGIPVDEGALPDWETLDAAVRYLADWYAQQDDFFRAGLDRVTTHLPGAGLLADGDLAVAPAIPGLLDAFDAAVGWPLGTLLEYAKASLDHAAATATD